VFLNTVLGDAPFFIELNRKIFHRKEVDEMKEMLALFGAVLVLAYVIIQALLAVLQPLFTALSGKLH
jgi:hypothetical protein